MKSNKELIEIFENKEKSGRDYLKFMSLNSEEKKRIFDLIINGGQDDDSN